MVQKSTQNIQLFTGLCLLIPHPSPLITKQGSQKHILVPPLTVLAPLDYKELFSSLPALKPTVLEALIWIVSPVLGFLPARAFLVFTANVPNPTSWTALSYFSPFLTQSTNALTALSAAALEVFSSVATASISSCLFKCFHLLPLGKKS